MEENAVDKIKNNVTDQSERNEWKYTKVSNNEQNKVEGLNDTTINNNVNIEKQENNYSVADNRNTQSDWVDQFESNSHNDNKNKSGFKRGRGGFNKSNYGHNSFEKTSNYDSTSNHFQNNEGHVIRGRGRGFVKRFNLENESFGGGYNNQEGNTSHGYRGRGRANHRGRGGWLKENSSDNWCGNAEEGYKKKENDKSTGPKPVYIPPDIENKELIAGIEAGLNFDKYETIEVKVSGIDPPEHMSSFHNSGLCDILLDNLSICNFSTPTPIQNYAIPIIISGRDLMASAQTGSGKTVSLFIF